MCKEFAIESYFNDSNFSYIKGIKCLHNNTKVTVITLVGSAFNHPLNKTTILVTCMRSKTYVYKDNVFRANSKLYL